MSHQNLKQGDSINITLLLAHARCMSELIHTLPQHKFEFKAYFKELFDTVKKYEEALNKLTNYNEGENKSKNEQEIYDLMMELTYDVRDAVLKKLNDGDTNNGPDRGDTARS